MAILTIGHSVLLPDDFVDLALEGGADTIVDVRSHPTSRWEWFRLEEMKQWLPQKGLRYVWLPDLGGWTAQDADFIEPMAKVGVDVAAYTKGAFPKQRIAKDRPASSGPSWTNQGLYDYAWFMSTPRFARGLHDLLAIDGAPAIMCAEALWWKCHRSMVADVLGIYSDVEHIMPNGKLVKHDNDDRLDRYPTDVLNALHRHMRAA